MHSWDEAASIRIDFAGYSDWRLPEFEELKSLFDPQFSKPAMNHIAFPHIPSACYWSSTTFETNYHAKLCKYLCFNDDRSTGQYTVRNKFHVRLVRDASTQTKEFAGHPQDEEKVGNPGLIENDVSVKAECPAIPANASMGSEWIGTGIDYLMREIERSESPSRSFKDSLSSPEMSLIACGGKLRRTLLHHAAGHNRLETVNYLFLTSKFDINIKDGEGFTPLDYALAAKAKAVEQYLVAKGALSRADFERIEQSKVNQLSTVVKETSHNQESTANGSSTDWGSEESLNQDVSRFIDNDDGTIYDAETGLMWMRCAAGQRYNGRSCSGQSKLFTIEHAQAMHLEFCGYNDWRLPTLEELRGIVDHSRKVPPLASDLFEGFKQPSTPLFWTSTSADGGRYYVSFLSGSSFIADAKALNAVRLVRTISQTEKRLLDNEVCRNPVSADKVTVRDGLTPAAPSPGPSTDLHDIKGLAERFDTLESRLMGFMAGLSDKVDALTLDLRNLRNEVDSSRQPPTTLATEVEEFRHLMSDLQRFVSAQPAIVPPDEPVADLAMLATLQTVLGSLLHLEATSFASLRESLLPLDLLPSAVIEEINEKAFDLVGELALEEDGEQVLIYREVLRQVLATMGDLDG